MTLSISKLVALALTGLALGACAARTGAGAPSREPRYLSLDAMVEGRQGPAQATVPQRAATPVAVLPDWIGRPTRVRERDAPDAFEQAVSLSLAPRGAVRENLVLVRMPRAEAAADVGSVLPGGRPSEAGIRAELAAAFPGTPMQVVTRPVANAYGPYGLAIGREARGARCLYAWQWIDAAPNLDPAAPEPGPLSLRIRLCRDDVTLDAMAAAMNQVKLVPRFKGTPATPAPATRGLAAAARQRPKSHAAVAKPHDEDFAGRRAPAQAEPARADTATPSRSRYLGVTDAAAASPDDGSGLYDARPGPAAMSRTFGVAPSTQVGAITADLPPEALRGPVARPAAHP